MIPVVVISMRRSADRRAVMDAHLDQHGIPFSYFDAVDGREMTEAEIAIFRPPLRSGGYAFPLTPAEIGCAASYLAVLRGISGGPDEHVCVLEDDAEFAGSVHDILDEEFLRNLPPFDVLRMHDEGGDAAFPRRFIARLGERCIYAPVKMGYCTTGQIFSRAGAARIASDMLPLQAPLDHLFYFDMLIFGLRVLELRPALVMHRPCPSNIGDDDRRIFRELHRPRSWVDHPRCQWVFRQMRTPQRWLRSLYFARFMASYARAWGIGALARALWQGSNRERELGDTTSKGRRSSSVPT